MQSLFVKMNKAKTKMMPLPRMGEFDTLLMPLLYISFFIKVGSSYIARKRQLEKIKFYGFFIPCFLL